MNFMKKIAMLMFSIYLCIGAYSQDSKDDPPRSGIRFIAGISYSYMSADLQLAGLSKHSVWYGTDFGTYVLSDDEIKEVNDHIERNNAVNNVNLEFGMILFERPESKWKASAGVLAGIARSNAEIYNNLTDTSEYTLDSKFIKPCLGVEFDLVYAFDPHWELAIKPLFVSTFGETEEITDNINVVPEGFTMTTTDTYHSFYQRLSLMARYTTGNFSFSAGPGLYLVLSNHEYTIERVYASTGELLLDEINSRSINRSFIDASLSANWNITGPLSLYVFTGIGKDIIVNTGITVNF
jgi:hypothetical protein